MRTGVRAWLLAALACLGLSAQPHRAVSPYTWTEDFQAGNLGQFASYPPVQDIGYDPSLSPGAGFGPPGGRGLMRVVKPTRNGDARFGFIRRLDLLTVANGSLSFAYRIDHTSPGDQIEAGIAGSDGRRYVTTLPIDPGAWRTAQIPMARFVDQTGRAVPPQTGIAALFLVAGLKHADADIAYRFLVGNLKLEAARELRFEVRTPRTTSIAHWPELFSTAGSEPGQAVAIEAAAPLALVKAECVAMDQDGRPVATIPLRKVHDEVWSGSFVPATRGITTVELRGTAADGRGISTRVRMLAAAAHPSAHPRLFFGPQDRDRLIARTQDPKYAAIWSSIQQRAAASRNPGDLSHGSEQFSLLDPVNLLPTLPGYFGIISKAGASMEFNALDAYLTGNAESRAAAKSALLAVARWNSWAPPWFQAHGQQTYYPAGQLAAQMALSYDILYDDLTPDGRTLVRQSLLEYGIARSYREYVVDNRLMANTSNWIGHTVGGALVAAAAIWGDGPTPELATYTNGLLRKLEDHLAASYLADGSYGEGISYQEFDLETDSLALNAVERVFGIYYWGRSHVKDSLWYPISTLAAPTNGSLDMGDSHPPAGSSIASIVARSGDPVLRWYYDHFTHRSLQDFLFADFSVAAHPPPGTGSRYFPQKGSVVFRTGWGDDDSMLLYRAGPNFNHNHADQGSFLFRAFGDNLVTEAGYSDYYKDPYYDSYFKQAIGHNTVLVDGDSESQEIADTAQFGALDRYPRITGVILSPSVDAVGSELQQVYRDRLRRYNRRIVFLKPDYFLVYDDLTASQPSAEFDWLLHLADAGRVKTEGATSFYSGAKAVLGIDRLFPSDASVHLENGHIPYAVFNPLAPPVPPAQPAILKLSAKAPAGRARLLVALAPARTEQSARSLTSALHPVEDALWIGVESRGPRQDLVLFRKEESTQEAAYGPWSTDAAVLMVRREADRDTFLGGQTVSILKRDGRILFTCDRPVSFVAEYHGAEISLSVTAPAPARARIARSTGELAEVAIAAGQQQLTIR